MSDMYVNLDTLALNAHLMAVTTQREQRGDKEVERVTVALLRDGEVAYSASAVNPKTATGIVKTLAGRIAADDGVAWDGAVARRWTGSHWADMTPEVLAWGAALSGVLGIHYADTSTKPGFLQTCYVAGVASAAGKPKRVYTAMGSCPGVPVREGVLQYSKGGWVLAQHSPDHANTAVIEVSSDAVREHIRQPKKGSLLHRYMHSALNEDQRFFIGQWLGLHLIKHSLKASAGQKFLLLQGPGGDGKSQLVDMIAGLVGQENVCFKGLDDLHDRTYHMIEGKAALLAPENDPNKPWAVRAANAITCGEALTARPIWERPRTFWPVCLITQVCNEIPAFGEHSRALERRMLVFKMSVFFDQDGVRIPDIGKKIVAEELAQLVGFALLGAQRIYENGCQLDIPESISDAGKEAARADIKAEDMFKLLDFGPYAISVKELRALHVGMCEDAGQKPVGMPKLLKDLIRIAGQRGVKCGDGIHTPLLPEMLPKRTGYDRALEADNKVHKRPAGPISIIKDPRTGLPVVLSDREDVFFGARIKAEVLDDLPVGLSRFSVDQRARKPGQERNAQVELLPTELALAKAFEIAKAAGLTVDELEALVANAKR